MIDKIFLNIIVLILILCSTIILKSCITEINKRDIIIEQNKHEELMKGIKR